MISFFTRQLKFTSQYSALIIVAILSSCGGGGGSDSAGGGFDNSTTKPQASMSSSAVVVSSESSVPQISSSSSSQGQVIEAPSTSASSKANSSVSSSSKSSITTNALGNSSSSKSVATFDTKAPNAPELFLATSLTHNMVTIEWTPADDNVGVAFYRIYRDGVQIDTVDSFETSYTDFNVASSKYYSYGISAGDAAGNWSQLIFTDAETTAQPVAGASSLSSTSPSSASNSSSSTSSSLSSSTASSVAISSATTSASTLSLSSATSSSRSSSSTSSSTPDTTAPSAPATISKDLALSTRVDLSWSAATDNVAVTQYRVYRDSVSLATLPASTFVYSDVAVNAAQQYTYSVAAGDAAGNWSAFKTIFVTTPQATSSTSLGWAHPTQRENLDSLAVDQIGGYEIRYKRPSDKDYTYVTVMGNKTTSFSIVGIASDASYEIACFDLDGNFGEFSSIALP